MADQKLELDYKERVAFDLMQRIYSPEGSANADAFEKPNARTYYLTLFHQFMKAARAVAALRTEEPTGVATAPRSARRGPVYAAERQSLALRKQIPPTGVTISNRMRPHVLACFAVLALVGSCAAALETSAATITVNTTSDLQPGINVTGCSLREAVNAINNGSNGAGCNNSSNRRYGDRDVILFAQDVGTVTLRYPATTNSNVALFVRRPVTIRGNGPLATAIVNERLVNDHGPLTLIQNSSELRLYRLRLSDAQTALINNPDAVAFLWSVHVTGHTWRAVVNRGRMTMLSVTVRNNVGGGGILNGNFIAANGIVNFELFRGFLLCVASGVSPGECGHDDLQAIPDPPDDTITFPAQQAPAQLTILRSAILNNRASECAGILNGSLGAVGGGLTQSIFVAGSLNIRHSRISGNSSNDNGGGICNKSAAFISHSEISLNTATRGGGVAAFADSTQGAALAPRPSTTIVTSTVSSNLAFAGGGGIFVGSGGGEMSLSYCTVALNRANGTGTNDAGGIAAQLGSTTVRFGFNALTNNRSGASDAAVQDCGNVALQGAFNFWPVANTGTCSLTGASNVQTGDARLGTLADNGSPRRSHLPAANSALVDVIPANDRTICNGTDQRSQTRPREGNNARPNGCDIGAVERP